MRFETIAKIHSKFTVSTVESEYGCKAPIVNI